MGPKFCNIASITSQDTLQERTIVMLIDPGKQFMGPNNRGSDRTVCQASGLLGLK